MATAIIPLRPKDDKFPQPKEVKDMLSYAVLFGCDNQTAYLRFHPEFTDENGRLNPAGKRDCKQVFSYARNREYMDAYKATVMEICRGGSDGDNNEEISEERKNRALQRLLHKAMKIVESGEELEPDDLKTVSEIFKKVGLLKDDNGERIEAPRRYLPERCQTGCRYRLFCEENIENGNIIDECQYCKALKVAVSHGYIYDPTTNLSMPKKNEEK